MSIAKSLTRWRTARRTANTLNRLSDRDLADVGIRRDAIYDTAWKAVLDKPL